MVRSQADVPIVTIAMLLHVMRGTSGGPVFGQAGVEPLIQRWWDCFGEPPIRAALALQDSVGWARHVRFHLTLVPNTPGSRFPHAFRIWTLAQAKGW